MKRIIVGLALAAGLVSTVSAADSTATPTVWKKLLEASLAVTQSNYTNNWAGGEVGSLVWAANVHGVAEKQVSPIIRSENDLKLAFGQTHSQSETTKNWASPVKSTDKIRFDTVWKFTLKAWVDPYAAGVFESQFLDASDTLKKRYLNPIDLTESAGLSKTLFDRATGKASTRLGFGLRQHLEKKNPETLNDGGLEWVTDWMAQVSKTLTYTTKLTIFQALFTSQEDSLDYWKETDFNWDNILSANVTKIVQVSLAWQMLYDKQIASGGRFKETLALGVSWKI